MSSQIDAHSNDPRGVDDLFNAALTEMDEHVRWDAIRALHGRGTREVLDRASALCRSPCSRERKTGAEVLGQLGVPIRTFPEECGEILLSQIRTEKDGEVPEAAFVAFSHLGDSRVIPLAAEFMEHPDPDIRLAIAMALAGHDDRRAIQMLVRLTVDDNADVRDWATFALASQTKLDIPEIRAALLARVDDVDLDVRGEALAGLALRRDPRVVAAIRRDLAAGTVTDLLVEAAISIRAPELHPSLVALQDSWNGEPDIDLTLLARAIDACRPV